MKKTITILSIISTLSLASASIDSNLKYAMKGQEVTELQEFLLDKGFLNTTPSGFFGLLTLKAVKAYQASEGLPSTGFVGAMTRQKINTELLTVVEDATKAEIEETGTSTPVVVDVCSNIEGVQTVVPTGMFMDQNKVCFVPQVQATPEPAKVTPVRLPSKDVEMSVNASASSITVVYKFISPSTIAACDPDTELKNLTTNETSKGDCSGGYITMRNSFASGTHKFEIYSPMYNLRLTKEFTIY